MVWSRLSLLGNHTPVTRFWTLLSRSYLATCVEFSPRSRLTIDEHTFVLTCVEVSPRRRLTNNELIPWPTLSFLRVLVLRKSVADFKLVSSRLVSWIHPDKGLPIVIGRSSDRHSSYRRGRVYTQSHRNLHTTWSFLREVNRAIHNQYKDVVVAFAPTILYSLLDTRCWDYSIVSPCCTSSGYILLAFSFKFWHCPRARLSLFTSGYTTRTVFLPKRTVH